MAIAPYESVPSVDAVFLLVRVHVSHQTHVGSVHTIALYSGDKA